MAVLTAQAVERACADECGGLTIYVRDQLFTADTKLGAEEPMPTLIQLAIGGQLGSVQFVNPAEADSLFDVDALVDGGKGVLVYVGPVEVLASDVVGVEVGIVTARDGGHGEVYQFQWSGETWDSATSEDTGIAVDEWLS